MIRTKRRKLAKDEKRCDLITISGVSLLLLAVLVMYRSDQPSGQTGASTTAVKEAAAQASTCVDNARKPCDGAGNEKAVALVGGEEKAKGVKPSGAK
jgi:hypothetical protein